MLEQFVLEKIQKNEKKLSKSQKLVADFLIQNPEKVSYMTAAQIAMNVGVSETTVIRMAMSLGFSKFSQLQENFREEVINQRMVQRFNEVSEEVEGHTVLQKSLQKDIENIKTTLDRMNEEEFHKAVELIVQARKIYTLGFRSSISDAHFLGFTLNNLLGNADPIISFDITFENCLKNSAENDLIIIFSYPRYTAATLKTVQFLKQEKGCQVIGITDKFSSPITPFCDLVFLVSIDSYTPNDSHVAGIALSNALISAVGQKSKARVNEQLNNLEDYFSKMEIFSEERRGY
jgi:DNA-binding MurR/RpiR family transcriptional regulator